MVKTVGNLAKALIGESLARNRYSAYSAIAKREGYERIAAVFAATADQEAEHAKWHLRMLHQLMGQGADISGLEVSARVPTDLGDTAANLRAAIAGEHYENSEMYPGFAGDAIDEGLPLIAARLRAIAKSEENHEGLYAGLLRELEGGTMFEREGEVVWVCRKCGHIHAGRKAPGECPSCGHPQGYFEARETC
ncbi:rubrerythrin family protein [Candidatus Uhrbacteria bacterium]|nr:rubrerythrin family protein [Candidatus Uhrbacteria bacterium]